ncbi:hypothetical protein LSCM1_00887 [Leishmania martiniquensis]|uniref:Uncharacterized protein n=1 Tax=Leishmania martiniquensis TaxID=1580590 RepID=A0A836K834_9TRYP|nr:hypothetical protein LSCM1_00887 [Leishmania martiniquensis]
MATATTGNPNGVHGLSPTPPPLDVAASALALDRKVVQALFMSLRMSIPQDVQRRLLSSSAEELQFLIARQPRLSPFHHRRRESLRHPALAMATKKYYRDCRRRRCELTLQQMAAVESRGFSPSANSPAGQDRRGSSASLEFALVDLLFAEYAQQSANRAKGQDRQVDIHGTSTCNGSSTYGGFAASRSSVSISNHATSAGSRLLSRAISDADNEASSQLLATPRGGRALELSRTAASGIQPHRSPPQKHQKSSNEESFSAFSDAFNAGSTSRFSSSVAVTENAEGGGGARMRGLGLGASTTSAADGARFFARRIGLRDSAAARGGGRGPGEHFASGGTGEMRALLRRCMEEEHEAGTGNDPFLFISARPVEHLLCCYGGASRDPASMVHGAALMQLEYDGLSTSDADPFRNAMVEEDVRWDQLAGCHRQILRAAREPCQAAAAAVANDRLVNDVIRRFWDRLTVSMAAHQAHKAQEAHKSRAAADADIAAAISARRGRRSTSVDEDDLNEISNNDDRSESSLVGRDAASTGSSVNRRSKVTFSRNRASRIVSKVPRTLKSALKPSKKKARKGSSADSTGSSGGSEQYSTVAYYMTPLQYVYLHTRIAHVLLPDCHAIEVELLPYIQEDLLVDAAYDEEDTAQTLYFGKAPRLVGDSRRQRRKSAVGFSLGPRSRASSVDSKLQLSSHDSAKDDPLSTGAGEAERDALVLQRWFRSVRHNGYALSRSGGCAGDGSVTHEMGLGDDGMSIGPTSSMEAGYTLSTILQLTSVSDKNIRKSVMGSLPLVPMSFTVAQLPSLTYPQFWCSMLELADNWTSCGGNPVETAVFMWELYVEVFGHFWGEEDQLVAAAVESKVAKSSMSATEKAAMAREEAEVVESFQALLAEMRECAFRPSSLRSSLNNGTIMNDGAHSAADGSGPLWQYSRAKDARGTHSLPTLPTDTDDDASLLLASCSDLPVPELKRLVEATGEGNEKWLYAEHLGEDGVTRRYRFRVRHTGRRARSRGGSQLDSRGEPYIVEEELDESGAVVNRRKWLWPATPSSLTSQSESDTSLYTVDENAPEFLRRRYYDNQPKKLRRLESWRRVSAGHGSVDSRTSSMTSWSTIDDGDNDTRLDGRRRRCRTRRTGFRRDRLRYSKEEHHSRSRKSGRKTNWKFLFEEDVAESVGRGSRGRSSGKSRLTKKELDHLRERKDWLCSLLKTKGVDVPLEIPGDPAEQMLLYDLLLLAEKEEGVGDQGNSRRDSGDYYRLEDGEAGGAGNKSGLAALLTQLRSFTLDDLANSDLMRRLLEENEAEGAASHHLTPQAMQDVLMALVNERRRGGAHAGAGAPGQESAQERRLRVLRMLEEQRNRRQQSRQDSAAAGSEADQLTEETFGLTEVAPSPPRPPSSKARQESASPANLRKYTASQRPHSAQAPPLPDTGTPLPGFACASLDVPRRIDATSRESSAPSTMSLSANSIAWRISPTTLAERKELERLFRELEAYWADRASHGGRFRVDIVDYTPEQLEEFFAHLHLGPRQCALLRGRAPLAPATSLVGGTLHQDGSLSTSKAGAAAAAQKHDGHATSGQPAHSLIRSPQALAPAPVKLFTLTTEGSLDGALRLSYQSYLADKAFVEALHGNVKLANMSADRVSTLAQSPRPPSLPRLKTCESQRKTSGERAAGAPATSAAPPPRPPKSSASLPSLPRL